MTPHAGIPRGTIERALELAADAAAAATRLTGRPHGVDADAVRAHVLLPLVAGDVVTPPPPRAVDGGGWVHADVLAEDRDLFELLAADGRGAEQLAAAAQECRLPVTPYRSNPALWTWERQATPSARQIDAGDVAVLDLTAMWAGPLATAQLAAWGAGVTTIEPPFRRDGLRGSPAQFAALDRGKRRVPWDLRIAGDRAAFEAAVRAADVLVESYSARVMPNLGYPPDVLHRLNPRLTIVSLRAFPASSAEASWVAFGRGVHASSGLGIVDGRPAPALLAYPDALAGLLAFGMILDALGGPGGTTIEISLADAMAPLLPTAGQPLVAPDDDLVARLRATTNARPGAVIIPA